MKQTVIKSNFDLNLGNKVLDMYNYFSVDNNY